MTSTTTYAPSREDFAALLDESYGENEALEGAVIKGIVVAIEKDVAVIDVGLKTEGRVALKEFQGPAATASSKVGDEVEVYLERIENALGEAVHLARQGAPRGELGQARKGVREAAKRSTASSSTRSRAASPSISTAPWPSCRAARSTSGRSAMSRR